jgi:hypothetical protein
MCKGASLVSGLYSGLGLGFLGISKLSWLWNNQSRNCFQGALHLGWKPGPFWV